MSLEHLKPRIKHS